MKTLGLLSMLATVVACMVLASPESNATTVDTFNFTQGGYTDPVGNPGYTGVLTGTFTGTVNDIGYIELGDLLSFSNVFTVQLGTNSPISFLFGAVLKFSFMPNDAGTLGIESSLDAGVLSCVGQPAAFGVCGLGGNYLGVIEGFVTDQAPVITLVSSITTGVPELSTWAMLLLGFAGLGCAYRRNSRVARRLA